MVNTLCSPCRGHGFDPIGDLRFHMLHGRSPLKRKVVKLILIGFIPSNISNILPFQHLINKTINSSFVLSFEVQGV